MVQNPAPERLSFDEADARLGQALSAHFEFDYDTVLFFDGDVVLESDFPHALAGTDALDGVDLVVVTGDLTVADRIRLYDPRPGLYVGGTTRAESLEGGDCEISIHDGAFEHLVYGEYNHGILDAGTVETPWVINSEHDLRVCAPGARRVNNNGYDNDADFDIGNIAESFVAEVVDLESECIDVARFLERLAAGLPVLRPGAQTKREAALAEVASARTQRESHVDLSNRELKEFPAEVLRMPWLRSLVLDGNRIGRLPDDIGVLSELELLSLRDCGLAELPDSIGRLSGLRVLRIAGNVVHAFSAQVVDQPIRLPDTIGRLTGLVELDVSRLSTTPSGTGETLPETTPFALPQAVGDLAGLRRLVADETNLVFPASMRGLAGLEEISLAGSAWNYLKRFPDEVTGFPNLRRLDLRGNAFPEVPDSLLHLTELEELNLNDGLALVRTPLPDLSRLPRLRVLKLRGRASRSGVPSPPHELLRLALARPLPALEELEIGFWGGDGRGPLAAEVLAAIGAFRGLKRVELRSNGLTGLPDAFFALPAVEQIDLSGNALSGEVCRRVVAAFPRAQIDLRYQSRAERDSVHR